MKSVGRKVKTGVHRLDEILEGGIPLGHTVLVSGAPGTGKTIFSMQFLFTGALEGEGGMYITLTEGRDKVLNNVSSFSFYNKDAVDRGSVTIIDSMTFTDLSELETNTLSGVINRFTEIVQRHKPKRIVIDSITSLCDVLEDKKNIPLRSLIFQLQEALKSASACTILLLSEVPPQKMIYSKYGMEEFIADGILLLTDVPSGKNQLKRALRVIKMRGVNHSRDNFTLLITSSNGIVLEPMMGEGGFGGGYE
ncbi:MAG: ATPase domain-containing protein [Candidatus Altiarchaeota archaeon]